METTLQSWFPLSYISTSPCPKHGLEIYRACVSKQGICKFDVICASDRLRNRIANRNQFLQHSVSGSRFRIDQNRISHRIEITGFTQVIITQSIFETIQAQVQLYYIITRGLFKKILFFQMTDSTNREAQIAQISWWKPAE